MKYVVIIAWLILGIRMFAQDPIEGFDNESFHILDTLYVDDMLIDSMITFTPVMAQQLDAGTTITIDGFIHPVEGNSGAKVMTSTPTLDTTDIALGTPVMIVGQHETFLVTLQDVSNLGGSALNLSGGNDFILGAGDVIWLRRDLGGWWELLRVDN